MFSEKIERKQLEQEQVLKPGWRIFFRENNRKLVFMQLQKIYFVTNLLKWIKGGNLIKKNWLVFKMFLRLFEFQIELEQAWSRARTGEPKAKFTQSDTWKSLQALWQAQLIQNI